LLYNKAKPTAIPARPRSKTPTALLWLRFPSLVGGAELAAALALLLALAADEDALAAAEEAAADVEEATDEADERATEADERASEADETAEEAD